MKLRTLKDLHQQDKLNNAVVFVRLDLNVPIINSKITDLTRINAALPTLKFLIENNCKLILSSHLGRPKGLVEPKFSLEAVATPLAQALNQEVVLAPLKGPEPSFVVKRLQPNQILLLENLRFDPGEEKNDPEFAKYLCEGVNLFVNDAFGTCHRAHASTVGIPKILGAESCAAGFLVEKEIDSLSSLLNNPKPPYTLVIGGAKVADKIGVMLNLMEHCNHILIGGAMAYTFQKYQGIDVGSSRVEIDQMNLVQKIFSNAKARNVQIHLPKDHIIANEFSENSAPVISKSNKIPEGYMGLDIGPQTQDYYSAIIGGSNTVFWNGPMGVFEWPAFAKGTLSIAKAMAENSSAKCVVGGGDSVAAVTQSGLSDKFFHISTGGGASLEFLEGKNLPGIQILKG